MLLRVLVLLLLVMNLGVGLWWVLRPPPAPPSMISATEPLVPALQLLSEREPVAEASTVAELVGPPEPIAPEPERACLEVGPFLTQLDLRRATSALTPVVDRLQFREARAVIRRGYRVFIPDLGSRDAALTRARELAARGLHDYYVVTAGDEQNTISLGLYRDDSNAQRRLEEVRALDFDARMEPRNEEVPQFWLDIDLPLNTDWRARMGGYSGIGSRRIPCA